MNNFLTRRHALFAGAALAAGGAAFYAAGGRNLYYAMITEEISGNAIDPPTAHELARAGKITLIDIRRPDEWARTGSPQSGVRLDMRRPDFIAALEQITAGDRSRPVALICARGVRSARLTNLLVQAGFTRIIDVPEGMSGSRAGPGWIKRGLPVDKT